MKYGVKCSFSACERFIPLITETGKNEKGYRKYF